MGKYGFTGKIEVQKFTNSFSGMEFNAAMEAQVNWLEFNLTTFLNIMKNGIAKVKYEYVLGFNFAGVKKIFDSELKFKGQSIYKLNGAIEWSPESSNIDLNFGIRDNYIKFVVRYGFT